MRLFLAVLVLLCIIFFKHQTRSNPQLLSNSLADRITHPFDTRLRYRLAPVDPRFGISQQDAEKLTQQAADLWQNAAGKKFFVYDPDAQLQIKLIYDERQENFNAFKKAQEQLIAEKNNNQRVSDNLNLSRDYLDRMYQNLQAQQRELDAKASSLTQQRMSWSRIESASGENMQRIEAEYRQYRIQRQQLESDINYFNNLNHQFNTQVSTHNQNIERYNTGVTQAKNRFPAREFHKGVFMGNEIQIYQFESEADLRLTLAHELGHALGIGHNADPKALMYPMLGDQDIENFKIQPADLSLLYAR